MTDEADTPPDIPAETPMQRALRLKQAARQQRPVAGPPKAGATKAMPTGQSKPWMKR